MSNECQIPNIKKGLQFYETSNALRSDEHKKSLEKQNLIELRR